MSEALDLTLQCHGKVRRLELTSRLAEPNTAATRKGQTDECSAFCGSVGPMRDLQSSTASSLLRIMNSVWPLKGGAKRCRVQR